MAAEVEDERADLELGVADERDDGRWLAWNEHEGMLEWGPALPARSAPTD